MANVMRTRGGALTAAVLILAATLLVLPGTASANRGRGHAWGRHRVESYSSYGYRPYYRRVAYRSYYRPYYRPYYASYYRPRYREIYVSDPYCDDDIAYVRPVYYRTHANYRHHRPRVAVSLSFGSPGYYYGGDPYCGW